MVLAVGTAFLSFDVVYSRTGGMICFSACPVFRFQRGSPNDMNLNATGLRKVG